MSDYCIILVYSTSHALRLEKALKAERIDNKLIPVPRQLSSDCGVCVRVSRSDGERVRGIMLKIGMDIQGVYDLSR